MVKVFYDADADVGALAGQTVAVIGYGIQGRAQCLNMRDAGVSVVVGNRDDAYRQRALEDGFAALDVGEAARRGQVVVLLIPDEAQADVYEQQIQPELRPGDALVFAHGFAIRYGLIRPPSEVDCLLVAPRMPGSYVRELFLAGRGVPAFVDVARDATGSAWSRALALAKAIGATRAGAMAVSFAAETELDHFSEHFVYPLVIGALEMSFQVLVESGYSPEVAVMELYGSRELGEVLIEAARIGLYRMVETHASPACQFGIHTYSRRLLTDETRERIRSILAEIRGGDFARALIDDQKAGHAALERMRAEKRGGPLEDAEQRLRELIRF
jgi:ketol-acid reductoisomerase